MEKKYFPYEWKLKEKKYFEPANGYTVFSCFAGGGGSTMGYKLAGFEVVGCNEIDPRMNAVYIENHNPKLNYCEPISDFLRRDDLPPELYNLDILDGSPPCSSFSTVGEREKKWGVEKKFREGQKEQILDTLFFDFIDLAKKLQPKTIVAENVRGLLLGEARNYLHRIGAELDLAGYYFDHRLLNGENMGLPQRRERVFIYAIRKDLIGKIETTDMFGEKPFLDLDFNHKKIPYCEIEDKTISPETDPKLYLKKGGKMYGYYMKCKPGDNFATVTETGSCFSEYKIGKNDVPNTLVAGGVKLYHYSQPRRFSNNEIVKVGAFPQDYNFLNQPPVYVVGMSVPPIMVASIAYQIKQQWLDKINK